MKPQFKKTGLPTVIQPEDVERRVTTALKTLWSLPDKERTWLRKQTHWPFATIDDRGDLNSQAENAAYLAELDAERKNRFQPTPADLADLHTALAWFNALGLEPKLREQIIRKGRLPLSPEQWLIWWRTRGLSFASIARRISTNDETARRRTAAAWHIAWQHANFAGYLRLRRTRADNASVARPVQPARDEAGLRGAGSESSGGDRHEPVRAVARGRQP